ncbi:hypothetical protein MNBD_CPR01-240 [hydrothermal vent metagenome]|uniref:Major facilitator superfamily (MFS) profile domain-containing protein n=1 Tax=hydrothermal vent metagenome TaxID=652676 RepID=A0A3B0V227_9ZZZZ
MGEAIMSRNDSTRWFVLATVIFGTFLGRLDQTVVNIALPKIINDFGITVTSAAWIVTAYILANAVFVPIWGKLGDTVGRKKIYLIGFIGFIIASGLCAFAWDLSSMVVFRVVQGFAVSADYPTAMAIVAVTFTNTKERAQALGAWSASFAVASVFGPLIAGPLIDAFSWRSIFFMNIPLGIIGLVLAIVFINESVGEKRQTHFDWLGSSTLATALFMLTFVLDRGHTWGWLSGMSIACYVGTVVFMGAFIAIERRESEPIINLDFFKITPFVFTLINTSVVFMAMMGSVLLIPIFSEIFLGYSATQTGFLFVPMAVSLMIAATLGGRLVGKIESRYVIFVGTIIATLGIFSLTYIDPRSGPLAIMIPMSILAGGLGLGMAQRTNIIATSVSKNEIGEASAILALVRNIAGAFGVAIFSTILESVINKNIINVAQSSIINSVTATAQEMHQFVGLIILKAEVMGYSSVYFIAAIIMLVGSFTAFFIKIPNEVARIHMENERTKISPTK